VGQRYPVRLRHKQCACEQPSQKEHWRRLHRAALRHNRKLTLVQIGANEGGTEGNEWIGPMVRDLGWRAALIEPVPFLYRLLKANARQSGPTAHITVHQLAVTAQTTVQTGRCAFQALHEKCFSSVTRRGSPYSTRQMNPKLRRASSVLVSRAGGVGEPLALWERMVDTAKLAELKALFDAGALTEEEFNEAKKEVITASRSSSPVHDRGSRSESPMMGAPVGGLPTTGGPPVGKVVMAEPVPAVVPSQRVSATAVVPSQRVSATLSPAGTPVSTTGTPFGAPDGGACDELSPAPSLRPTQPITL